jgi:hypothetical protein
VPSAAISRPALKPARFFSAATPSRIAAWNAESGSGRAPDAAKAPRSTAFTSEPAPRAASSASKAMVRRVSAAAASFSRSAGNTPSPRAERSPMANSRCVLATSVVRTGEA